MREFDGLLLNFTESQIKHFWDKVLIDADDMCWEWIGAKSNVGYGYFGKPIRLAHRVSYVLKYGKLPANLYVCHKCDNPSCVNPKHLFLGTHSENMLDRNRKGNSNLPYGENHAFAKLCDVDVVDIKMAYKMELFSQHELSKLYDVSVMTINDIIHGRTWKHVK